MIPCDNTTAADAASDLWRGIMGGSSLCAPIPFIPVYALVIYVSCLVHADVCMCSSSCR